MTRRQTTMAALKQPIGGPADGRPTMLRGKVAPGKKARRTVGGSGAIKAIGMSPAGKEKRNYLIGRSFGHQGVAGQGKRLGSVILGPRVKRSA